MKELALHVLDIAENCVAAHARNICISVCVNEATNQLILTVEDDGKGMSPELVAHVVDPFVTTRTTRKVGLGIPLLKAAAEACDGSLNIQSKVGKGTQLAVSFKLDHIDRMPMGNLTSTCLNLLIGYPDIHWTFNLSINSTLFEFDDAVIKSELGDIPLSDPAVITFLRTTLEEGFQHINTL